MLTPPRMIRSFVRPVTRTNPCSSLMARSPVGMRTSIWSSHSPSGEITATQVCGPPTVTSPSVPSAQALPSPSTIRNSWCFAGGPTVPIQRR